MQAWRGAALRRICGLPTSGIVSGVPMCNPAPKLAKESQQIGEQVGRPIFRQNRSPVPWISVPGPTHTFLWLLCRWSHVETQKMSQFSEKIFRLLVCTWSLSTFLAVQAVVEWYMLVHELAVSCLDEKIGFLCTNKACQKKMNAHRLPISISLCAGCAALICNQSCPAVVNLIGLVVDSNNTSWCQSEQPT